MNAIDRRRIGFATLFTVTVIVLVWTFSHGSDDDTSSVDNCAGCEQPSANSPPPTTAYVPRPPLFAAGSDDSTPPSTVVAVTAPPPDEDQLTTNAQFHRYFDETTRRCSTMLVPEGARVTVLNLDNGQSTVCINTQGIDIPFGVGILIHTDGFAEIGDLTDAPLIVRLTWVTEPII